METSFLLLIILIGYRNEKKERKYSYEKIDICNHSHTYN